MPTIKVPDIRGDDMIVTINRGPLTEKDRKELLTKVTLLSALRDRGLAKQGIRFEFPESFGVEAITVTGLQVAAYLAERFKDLDVTPKMWQKRVRFYEKNTAEQLQQLRQDLAEDIKTLEHTQALQEINRASAYLQRYYPRPQGRLHEGELSGLANPDTTIQVVQPDAHGQCPAGYLWSARVGGCVEIPDGTASTAFDISPGGNKADSDLRKARVLTNRTQFTPEGTRVALGKEAGPDNSGIANRAMGNAGIEVSNRNIDTAQMPGGSNIREGELSGLANPDQILRGIDPDSNGQCPLGYIFSAMVGKCIQLPDDQRADAPRRNRTQHEPEGTVTRLGRTYGHDNSDQPNPAMGFFSPLAMLQDEGWFSLSDHYLCCMRMLREANYSYYASKHATERFCFFMFEDKYDGYIGHGDKPEHMTMFHWSEWDEQALKDWQELEKEDFNKKTGMDASYEQQTRQRLQYRQGLADLIRRGRTDEQIQRVLETKAHLPRQTVRSLMTDVRMLRTIKPPPQPKIKIKWTSDSRGES